MTAVVKAHEQIAEEVVAPRHNRLVKDKLVAENVAIGISNVKRGRKYAERERNRRNQKSG